MSFVNEAHSLEGTSRCSFDEVHDEEDDTHSSQKEHHQYSKVETSTVVEVHSSRRQERQTEQIFIVETVRDDTLIPKPAIPPKLARMTQHNPKYEEHEALIIEEEPKDTYYLVYLIFVLNGGAIWMCWLLLNFLSPSFYFDYWYSSPKWHIPLPHAQQFMDSLGVDACTPLFVMSWLCVLPFVGDLGRSFGSLSVNLCALLTFLITTTWTPYPVAGSNLYLSTRDHMYNVTFPSMLIMMACTGIFQSSIYSMAADLPRKYTNATTIGNYVGGLICAFLYVFTTAANHKNARPTASTYYGFTFGYITFCTFALVFLYSSTFYSYHKKRAEAFETEKVGPPLGTRTKRYFSELGGVFKQAWPELINIFIVNFAFWTIWPALNIGIQPWPTPGMAHLPKYFLSIGTFLNFYTYAIVGAIGAACFVPKGLFRSKMMRVALFIPCALVWLFIPYFMYCNFHPNPPHKRVAKVIFKNIWFYYIGNGVFGLVIGFLTTLLMNLVSRVVTPNLSRLAARLAVALLITGLYFGAGMTPVYLLSIDNKTTKQ